MKDTGPGFSVWAGSDESGKGDSFGPLVVAAVVRDKERASALAAKGVKDSKAVSDRKALELEELIKDEALAYKVLELKPAYYNLRYKQLKAEGGTLNTLLASGHFNALAEVLKTAENCEGIIIDQFMTSEVLVEKLRQKFPNAEVEQTVRAEADTAVAAASVLARACFLRSMDELSKRAGLPLPKGSSSPTVQETAVQICEKFGSDKLADFAKLHFVNIQRVLRSYR